MNEGRDQCASQDAQCKASCASPLKPSNAQEALRARASELRFSAARQMQDAEGLFAAASRLQIEAAGLEMLASSLPGIMPLDAHTALRGLLAASHRMR